MSETTISVEHLRKRYRLHHQAPERYTAFRDVAAGSVKASLQRFRSMLHERRTVRLFGTPASTHQLVTRSQPQTSESAASPASKEDFWALQDVSFQVKQGEVVGIIGRNGAGKSTLLKILSRITEPTSGRVRIKGRVASLLEVGTGFHPELTGRENIFLNGAILGMARAEVRGKFAEIVAFAEIENFLDTPVKRYSSGMYVRLAFAVAAHLEPEILVLDEVLAVGDAQFQKKCLGKMKDVARSGRTVLFVSHNMSAVQTLCERAILLHRGMLVADGRVSTTLEAYTTRNASRLGQSWDRCAGGEHRALEISKVKLELLGTQPKHILSLVITLCTHARHKAAYISLDILDSTGTALMQALSPDGAFINDNENVHVVVLSVELPPFIPGVYSVSVWAGSHNTQALDYAQECVGFSIEASPTRNRTFAHAKDHGQIAVHYLLQSDDGRPLNPKTHGQDLEDDPLQSGTALFKAMQ